MPKARMAGSKARTPNKPTLTKFTVARAKPEARRMLIHDTEQPGLALTIERSGHKSYKLIYRFNGRVRWYHIVDALRVSLNDARDIARDKSADVIKGIDIQADMVSARKAGGFEELCERYIKEYAKLKLKAWKQSDKQIRLHLLPRWKHVQAAGLTPGRCSRDVQRHHQQGLPYRGQAGLRPGQHHLLLGDKERGGQRPRQPRHRNRGKRHKGPGALPVGSKSPAGLDAFDDVGLIQGNALRVILPTGQRLGEVRHVRWEDIEDGWWTMPGSPVGTWPGTKNKETHAVWLTEAVDANLEDLDDGARSGYVCKGARGWPIDGLDVAMRTACKALKVNDPVRPHDLRRTHGTLITSLGFRRDQMNCIQNHKEGGIASVYDRHEYADEAKAI